MELMVMVEAVLKNIAFIWEPDLIDDFVRTAQAEIGVEGEKGADIFYFRIMTPNRLLKMLEEERIIDGRGTFIVNEPDVKSILEIVRLEINKILQDCVRETWDEVAKAINRYLQWEYDNVHYETWEEAQARLSKDFSLN